MCQLSCINETISKLFSVLNLLLTCLIYKLFQIFECKLAYVFPILPLLEVIFKTLSRFLCVALQVSPPSIGYRPTCFFFLFLTIIYLYTFLVIPSFLVLYTSPKDFTRFSSIMLCIVSHIKSSTSCFHVICKY